MSQVVDKIFQELDELESSLARLSVAADAKTQTDLEVAILGRQLATERIKNQKAKQYIDESINMLKPLTTGC